MNKHVPFIAGLLLVTNLVSGQDYSGDVFRYSQKPITGTARFQGLGGNHAAVGGDASNAWGNPAGLGFYNRSEISISPSLQLLNTSSNYLGQTTTASKSAPFIGSASAIFAGQARSNGSSRNRTTFGITYSRQASLANTFTLQGRNNRSSLADSYVETTNGYNTGPTPLQNDFNSDTQTYGTLSAAAYDLYLVNEIPNDTTRYFRFDQNVPVNQSVRFTSSGAVSQWAGSIASNFNDKFYIGGTLGFLHTKYTFSQVIEDQYVGGRVFNSFRENSDYTVTGNGINLSVGLIYKLNQTLQFGATVISPTFTTRSYQETYNLSLLTSPTAQGIPVGNGFQQPRFTDATVAPNDFDFTITTPLRTSLGATYFFGRSGFLTATAEYVGYGGMKAGTNFYTNTSDNQAFKSDNTFYVQNTYVSTVNFRVGGEVRAGIFRARAGAGYIPSPYKANFDALAQNGDRNTILFSAGVGVRNDRFFADLGGAHYATKTSYTPYVLNNPANYASAVINNNTTTLTLTAGVFF